jgi:hypothetical protein
MTTNNIFYRLLWNGKKVGEFDTKEELDKYSEGLILDELDVLKWQKIQRTKN